MADTKTFFTSDLHFGHNKDFLYKPRGFDNIEEHDDTVIENWNSVVSKDDTVYVLGDIMMGNDTENSIRKLNRLNGNIIILLGNHDTNNKLIEYAKCRNVKFIRDTDRNIVPLYAQIVKDGKWSFYCSHYPTFMTGNFLHNDHLPKKIALHGHSHSQDKYEYLEYGCYNIALDAHNNTPVLLEDIKEDLRNEFSKRHNEWREDRNKELNKQT